MKIALKLTIAAAVLSGLVSCSQPTIAIYSGTRHADTDSLAAILTRQGYKCQEIESLQNLKNYDLVWCHRSDTTDLTEAEIAAAPEITEYLNNGGKVVLTMDAVRYSESWGLEPNPVELKYSDAIDWGFGRKVGYHGFRSHPLFDDTFGGAYVWHGYQDNTNRVLGYFGDNTPKAEGTKIIATLWEYIFYQPKEKVVWEQPVGKGSILSVGAFFYPDRPNAHKAILEKFTANTANYMIGGPAKSEERYWTYDTKEVLFDGAPAVPAAEVAKAAKASKPAKWQISSDPDALTFPATREELTLPSRRAMVVSEERGGIKEIWTHPIMSLKNYCVSVCAGGQTIRLDQPCADVEFRANAIIRQYKAGDVSVREILTASRDTPATIAHYEWDGAVDSLVVDFSSNLRYMWPYDEDALGTMLCGWQPGANCYIFANDEAEFVSILGTNLPAKLLSEQRRGNFMEANVKISVSTDGADACDVVMAAGSEGVKPAAKAYAAAIKAPKAAFDKSEQFYKDYLARTVSIVTPNELFNQGYRWATVSAGQFLAETPGLGTALMAGYSSSLRGWGGGHRVSGRPGYAWYFGRDSELSAFAFLSMGDFEAVRSTIRLLADFQGVNGTIFHELTTSGSDHFDASDATPLFVVLVSEYLKATGDTKFVKELMPNVYKAMDFCFTTDTDGDDLIEIEHVGHGWLEGGDYFTGRTEFYLSAIWLRALLDGASLAKLDGKPETAERYIAQSRKVKVALEEFWNPKGYYNYGKDYDMSFSTAHLALASVPVWLGVTENDRAYSSVMGYARNDFSDDWGVRQTNDPRPEESVGAYDESNIWPLFTGSVSLAEYYVGRYNQGFDHMMASLLCYRSATHGRVPEVLRGNSYRSGGITRHQCWSETAVTGPAIQGMLGYSTDATAGVVNLSPRTPFDWRTLEVKNLRSGDAVLNLDMQKERGRVVYTITSTKKRKVVFAPAFPPASYFNSVKVNGKETDFLVKELPEYLLTPMAFEIDGKAVVEIEMKEGASALPCYREAEDKGASEGIRMLSQGVIDAEPNDIYLVELQGKVGTKSEIKIYIDGEVQTREVDFADSDTRKIYIKL